MGGEIYMVLVLRSDGNPHYSVTVTLSITSDISHATSNIRHYFSAFFFVQLVNPKTLPQAPPMI
jgi:hypothetical protein